MKRYWYKSHINVVLSQERMNMPHWLFHRLIELEAIAADYDKNGLLPPVKEMAWTLRPCEEAKLEESLQALSEVGEVAMSDKGWMLLHFDERQESDSTERVRKFRERKQAEEDVTPVTDVTSVTDKPLRSHSHSNSLSSSDSLKEEGVGGENKAVLDLFKNHFGKFLSEKEIKRWLVLCETSNAEELANWALKKEIHLENRAGLLDSMETAAKNWKTKSNGRTPPKSGTAQDDGFMAELAAKRLRLQQEKHA